MIDADDISYSEKLSMNSDVPMLEVSSLQTVFHVGGGDVHAVNNVSFTVNPGDVLGIVGESGSGKSVTSRSIMKMITAPGEIVSGEIKFKGKDLRSISDKDMRRLRGKDIALIFQDPQAALNPVISVGNQLIEALTVHGIPKSEARKKAISLLQRVGIPDIEHKFNAYPHEFSGGMRQRVVIAMGLANNPSLLIADEPTTALDVTIQAQILKLIAGLRNEFNVGIIFITHDMGVVAELCNKVVVMYGGRVLESGSVSDIFERPKHPYTVGLLRAMPRLTDSLDGVGLPSIPGSPPNPARLPSGCAFHPRCPLVTERCRVDIPNLLPLLDTTQHSACWVVQAGESIDKAFTSQTRVISADASKSPNPTPLLSLRDMYVDVNRKRSLLAKNKPIYAVSGVSLDVYAGETLGLVGESGCGKSTISRGVVGIQKMTKGTIEIDGIDCTAQDKKALDKIRGEIQYVFQDPFASLNPRRTARQSIEEALEMRNIKGSEADAEIKRLASLVGLDSAQLGRYPAAFSGGQRQRLGIARALASEPRMLILDEPVSALDVSIQAQIINLLETIQDEKNLGYLFIAHDLSVVRHLSDRIAVMYLGRIVETGTVEQVYDMPQHPYTVALLSSTPVPEVGRDLSKRIVLSGDMPSPANPPSGCRFRKRCPIGPKFMKNREICEEKDPMLTTTGCGSLAACHFTGQLPLPKYN